MVTVKVTFGVLFTLGETVIDGASTNPTSFVVHCGRSTRSTTSESEYRPAGHAADTPDAGAAAGRFTVALVASTSVAGRSIGARSGCRSRAVIVPPSRCSPRMTSCSRSEERRVGKEGQSRWLEEAEKKASVSKY